MKRIEPEKASIKELIEKIDKLENEVSILKKHLDEHNHSSAVYGHPGTGKAEINHIVPSSLKG